MRRMVGLALLTLMVAGSLVPAVAESPQGPEARDVLRAGFNGFEKYCGRCHGDMSRESTGELTLSFERARELAQQQHRRLAAPLFD